MPGVRVRPDPGRPEEVPGVLRPPRFCATRPGFCGTLSAMGRRPASSAARTNVLRVRLTDDELAFCDARAAECGMSRSEFARLVLGGTVLGVAVPGRVEEVEEITPADQVVEARIDRPPPRPVRVVRSNHCPSCGGLTHSTGPGRRRCGICGWDGKV